MSRRTITTHPVNTKRTNENQIPHYYIPGLNTYLMNSISNSNEAVQFYSAPDRFNLPVPFVKFFYVNLRINAVLDLVSSKIRWKFENDKLLSVCREKLSLNTLNDIKNQVQSNEISYLPTKTIPLVLTSFTSHLLENPDKYFDSDYNWYFKNTIEKFQIDGKWYLACARGENLDILDIISINDDNIGQIDKRKRLKGPIFDIKSSSSNELMIRQKTKLLIFWNSSGVDTLLDNNSVYDNNDIPLADADISSNSFCTADVEHFIKIWKDKNCIQNKYFEIVDDDSDSFIRLSYLQDQSDIISIISQQKLYLIDSRTDISKPCSTYDSNTIVDKCEKLTALKSSNLNTHSVYVASNHSVLTFDNRMGFTHKTHHMLSNPPSLITSHCYDNSFEPNEMLFLGNQIGEGFISFSFTSFQDDFLLCHNMASSVPKPLDSLHKVRLQGHCLNPMLVDRFTRCLVGSTAVGNNAENLRLFSVNSAGDLFVQKLDDNTSIDVTEFEKLVTFKSKQVSKLFYSRTVDMSNLWKKKLPANCEENVEVNKFWNMSKKKMTSYVDHLAPLMLSPWDVDDLSEWENEEKKAHTINDDLDSDCISKVHFWFSRNDLLLGSVEPSELNPCSSSTINTKVQTSKTPSSSENDENSSSGYSLSLKSDDT